MMISKSALWLTRHWPVSTNYRLSYAVYLWLIGVGSKAFVAELYPAKCKDVTPV